MMLRIRSAQRRGFTLVELVIAAALAALVLLGLQSSVMIAAKAIPSTVEPADHATHARVLDQLSLELPYASRIVAFSANGITFVVPDRNGDGADDTIAYAWSGVAGAPLTRTFNGAAAQTVLADAALISFSLQTEVVPGTTTYVDSNETLLASYSSSASLGEYAVNTLTWIGQQVAISIPETAVDFRTTRVRLTANASGAATGTSVIELRSLRNRMPSARTVASASFNEPSSVSAVSCTFPSVRFLDRTEPVALVVRPATNPPSCGIVYQISGVAAAAGANLTTANGGASWSSLTGRSMLYELWGVYRTAEAASNVTRATFVRVTVRAGAAPALELNLPLANRPEVRP